MTFQRVIQTNNTSMSKMLTNSKHMLLSMLLKLLEMPRGKLIPSCWQHYSAL